MKLSQAAKMLQGELIGKDAEFTGLSIDSRSLAPGQLFIALKGEKMDGHQFVKKAQENGAVAALVSSRLADQDFPIILVPNTHHALMQLAQEKRATFKNPIITVTGSCGKTTTRAFLESVFAQAGKVLASVKSFNNNIGVPLTLMRLDSSYDFAICELGANHAGELAELTALVRPKVAIITNAAAVHLEGFGSVEGVAKAKGEIFQGLSEDGVAIINHDDHFASYWRELTQAKKQLSFGLDSSADVRAENIIFNEKIQPEFDLILPRGKARVKLNLMGLHNVNNALAAAAAAFALGLSVDQIKAGLENSVAVEKRLVEIKGFNGATVIDDSYNANPLSVMAAISVLAKRDGHSILVLGDMKELGENAADFHTEIGQKARQLKISQLYAYGDLSRYTAKAFGENGFYFDNQDELISELKKKITAKDTILVKGSNSMGMDLVAKALII